MHRRVWVGALALGLGGVLSGLGAQQPVWRPAPRPAPTAVRGVSRAPAPVALGRAVALTTSPAIAGTPRVYPPAYRTGPAVEPKRPQAVGEAVPIATVPPPGAVIAASHSSRQQPPSPLPSVDGSDELPAGDQFAVDRVPPRPPALRRVQADDRGRPEFLGVQPPGPAGPLPAPGNWATTWPVGPPGDVPPVMELPYGAELPPPRFYLAAEYLLWWARRDRVPVLATTGDPARGLDGPAMPNGAGVLGNPDTNVLFGGGGLGGDARSGARFTAGWFLDDCGGKAIEVTGFFLGQRADRFEVSSAQAGVIARPFFSLNENRESVEYVAFPRLLSGRLTVDASSELWGLEANLRCRGCCGCDWRVEWLGGFRFLNLDESITITENLQVAQDLPRPVPPFLPGTRILGQDRFATSNQFYGGQLGVAGRWQTGRLTLDGQLKVALGVTSQEVSIDGFQQFPPGTPTLPPSGRVAGGLLALPGGNIGTFSRDRFSVVPEVGVTLGYYLAPRLRATVGYNFLYWSNVLRPGEQIDRNLDVNRIPNFRFGAPAPALSFQAPTVPFKGSDFWAQGLTFGLEFKY